MEHRLAITSMTTATARAILAIAQILSFFRGVMPLSAIGDRYLLAAAHPGGSDGRTDAAPVTTCLPNSFLRLRLAAC